MRRMLLVFVIAGVLAVSTGLSGCTFSREEPATSTPAPTRRIVTATLSGTLVALMQTPSVTPTSPASPTPPPTDTPEPSPDVSPTASSTPQPTVTDPPTVTASFTPAPTRTPAVPPTVIPLDDGSGRPLSGTGSSTNPVQNVDALPESLYYLSDEGGSLQVWRLPYGHNFPKQLTRGAPVVAFDVAPDGKLAYIIDTGQMFVKGVPFALAPDVAPTMPHVTSLAWSPSGVWLALTLETPGAASGPGGAHPVDGLWIWNLNDQPIRLAGSVYPDGSGAERVFDGPINWRPPNDGELLVGHTLPGGHAYSRVNLVTSEVTPAWNDFTLPPSAYDSMQWSVNGTSIITSGSNQALRIEPDTLGVLQTLVGPDVGIRPVDVQQYDNGAVSFVGIRAGDNPAGTGPAQIYLLEPNQAAITPISESLTSTGTVDILWDYALEDALVVVYDTPDARVGTPFLRTPAGPLVDVTPLTGRMGSPMWSSLVKEGDTAQVWVTSLQLHTAPNGDVLTALSAGTQMVILGGPRRSGGVRWWQVRTNDGLAGWVAEWDLDPQGFRERLIVPVE